MWLSKDNAKRSYILGRVSEYLTKKCDLLKNIVHAFKNIPIYSFK